MFEKVNEAIFDTEVLSTVKIRLLIPVVQSFPRDRPTRCLFCQHPYVARHGTVAKPITDTKLVMVQVVRYRCSFCGKTFRQYPGGVSRSRQSWRVVVLASLLYAFGLSCSVAAQFLHLQEVGISPVTVWRDAQLLGHRLRRRSLPGRQVRVLGADETYVRVRGRTVCLGLVTDAATGETLGVDVLIEQDAVGFLRWLRRFVHPLGVEVLVTDDLSTYKPVVQGLKVQHQVCIAHVRKNVTKRLRKLPGQDAVKELVRELVRDFPPWGERALRELAKTLRGNVPWRRFLSDLAEKWPSLRRFVDNPTVPSTNNVTERAIGRSKVRYKTVRGFKSEDGMLNLFALTQWLYTPQPVHDFQDLMS